MRPFRPGLLEEEDLGGGKCQQGEVRQKREVGGRGVGWLVLDLAAGGRIEAHVAEEGR